MTATNISTEEVIAGMLRENTGRAICDSGGEPKYDGDGNYIGSEYGYGRNHERNQTRDFESEPEATLCFRYGIEFTHNVYHWLKERVEFDTEMQERYDAWVEENSEEFDPHLADMQEFVANLDGWVGGLYGDGDPIVVNTYNHESLLSQTLQYVLFTYDDTTYVLLQIHGGCDVRGGYTAPKVFRLVDDGSNILCDGDGSIYCVGERSTHEDEHCWSTDDGYHFYWGGDWTRKDVEDLQDYEQIKIDSADEWEEGKLCVLPDGTGLCPLCGSLLEPSTY